MREVRQIPYEQAIPWFLEKHYAHRVPSVSWAYGLYLDEKLEGVVSYGKPASYTLCEGVCGKENSDKVIELNRLILNEGVPKNSASYLVGKSLRLLPAPKIVVSFSDTDKGHIGYIYQATNFIYTGISPRQKYFKLKSTEETQGYRRRARMPKQKIIDEYGEENVELYYSTDKHRYVYFAGCPELKEKLNYKIQPYPKGETKRYDSGDKLLTQGILL